MQDTLSTPGPKYSTIAPVPPLTDRMPATLQMMSLGEVHLLILPVSFTPITCRPHQAPPVNPTSHRSSVGEHYELSMPVIITLTTCPSQHAHNRPLRILKSLRKLCMQGSPSLPPR